VKQLVNVGVTGTNGKTSTTHFLASALGALAGPVGVITTIGMFLDEERVEAPRSYAGMLDVLSQVRHAGGRFAALEVTSEVLARGFAQAFPFRAAAFTNLTRDHFDAHGSAEHYFASKAQLFKTLPAGGVAVVNGADDVADLLREVTPAHARFLSYGVTSRGEAQVLLTANAEVTRLGFEGTALSVQLATDVGGGSIELRTRAIGAIFAENALCAWLTAVALGVPADSARDAIAARSAPSGRFEVVATSPWVVVDYAHTPDALARTLDTARRLSGGRVSVVFGAGGNRDRGKRPQLGAAAAAADRILITNDNPRSEDPRAIADAIRSGLPATADVAIELDRVKAVELAVLGAAENDVIVLAGKGHEETQTAAGQAHEQSDQVLGRAAHARRPGR
jgi:UDP-N-acetylmuramoyl-L-alanyl-D-glutamate--2,6-diaminopimelate ligase